MTKGQRMDRQAVIALLAQYNSRSAEDQIEEIDSIELAWIIHQVEQSHDVELDLDDEQLARMSVVAGVVSVLDEVIASPADV